MQAKSNEWTTTLLLVGISVLIVPYLIYTVRAERRA